MSQVLGTEPRGINHVHACHRDFSAAERVKVGKFHGALSYLRRALKLEARA